MQNAFSRMEILLGEEGSTKLAKARIMVFGLGGVGSYVAEALARCGVGSLTLVDHDTVSVTNINRQLYALRSTVGHSKVQVAKERIRDIDENILVHTYETFYNEDTADMFDFLQILLRKFPKLISFRLFFFDICRTKYKLYLSSCWYKTIMFISLTLTIQHNAYASCLF